MQLLCDPLVKLADLQVPIQVCSRAGILKTLQYKLHLVEEILRLRTKRHCKKLDDASYDYDKGNSTRIQQSFLFTSNPHTSSRTSVLKGTYTRRMTKRFSNCPETRRVHGLEKLGCGETMAKSAAYAGSWTTKTSTTMYRPRLHGSPKHKPNVARMPQIHRGHILAARSADRGIRGHSILP